MPEPEYIYVKGSGWVPRTTAGRWKVIFRVLNDAEWSINGKNWANADHDGYSYDTFEEAEKRYKDALKRIAGRLYEGWEYKLVPASEFLEYPEQDD